MSDLLKIAFEQLVAKDYESAWQTLMQITPETPYQAALKGRALTGLQRPEQARATFDRAIQADPDCAEALAGRGQLCFGLGDLETAQHDLDLAVKLEPAVGRFHGARGMLLAEQGRLVECLKELETAYRLGDHSPEQLLTAARIHSAHGRNKEALESIERARKHQAPASAINWAKASVFENAGQHQQALEHYRQALQEDSSQVNLWLAAVRVTTSVDRPNLLATVERAIQHHPDEPRLVNLASALYREAGTPERGVPVLRAAQLLSPHNPQLLVQLGDLLRLSGSRLQAAVAYEKALELDPTSHQAWFGKGALSQPEDAAICYRKAVSHAPDRAAYHYNLGATLNGLGHYQQALEPLHRSLELDPSVWQAHHELATALAEVGRHQEAIVNFDQALELGPECAKTLSNRGNSRHALGQTEAAFADYRRALEIEPLDPSPRLNWAEALVSVGRYEEAEVLLQEVLNHEHPPARAWYDLGAIHHALQRVESAESCFQKACELDPTYARSPYEAESQEPGVGFQELVQRGLETYHTLLPSLHQDPIWNQLSPEGFAQLAGLYAIGLVWLYREEYHPGLDVKEAEVEELGLLESLSELHQVTKPARHCLEQWLRHGLLDAPGNEDQETVLTRALGPALAYLDNPAPEPEINWPARETEFRQSVSALGSGVQFVVDLEKGRYYLTRGEGDQSVTERVADLTVLAMYSKKGEFRAGWACPEVDIHSRPQPLMGIPGEFYEAIPQSQVWELVGRCGARLEVDTILSMPGPDSVMFVGLSNLRPPGPGESHQVLSPRRAAQEVARRLQDLLNLVESAEFEQHCQNHASALKHHAMTLFRGLPLAERLQATAEELKTLGQECSQAKTKLQELLSDWEPDDA